MSRLTSLSIEDVHAYLAEHNIEVFLSHEDEWEGETFQFWGCNTSTGFSTFDGPLTEDKAKYAAVLFHKLVADHNMYFGDAEALAYSYVTTFKVMEPPPSEEEVEEARQAMLAALREGRVTVGGMDDQEREQGEFDFMKEDE